MFDPIEPITFKLFVFIFWPNIAGQCQKTFCTKNLLTIPSNVLPLHLKQTFHLIIWIFTDNEGDGTKFRLSSKIFFTLPSELWGLQLEQRLRTKNFQLQTLFQIQIYNFQILLKQIGHIHLQLPLKSTRFNKVGPF